MKGKSTNHICVTFQPETAISKKLHNYISCRICKRSVIEVIGLSLLRSRLTKDSQVLVLTGFFCGSEKHTPIIITGDSLLQSLPTYTTNAEEADLIIWKQVKECLSEKILIYSQDSDVHSIGLGLFDELHKDIIIQLNPLSPEQISFSAKINIKPS